MKLTKDYAAWLGELKGRIHSAQIKAALKVNAELLNLYWDLGREISEKEKTSEWGDKLVPQLSKDLLGAFPEMKGFSRTNLYYIKKWFLFYTGSSSQIVQQVVGQLPDGSNKAENQSFEKVPQVVGQFGQQAVDQLSPAFFQIPWGHHLQIISKCKELDEAIFYIAETTRNNWSRSVLVHQIESTLYDRQGKAIHNFDLTLPKPQSDLARELLKNPYNFDFLSLGEEARERDIETALVEHITKFLLELGQGFAYVGRQYKLQLDGEDYAIDLLFYHTRLHCFVVIELKGGEFKPEYAGKLNFYLNIVDDFVRGAGDGQSVGLLLCRKAGKLRAEYALRGIDKPIGISAFQLSDALPDNLKGSLPTIEEIEAELNPE